MNKRVSKALGEKFTFTLKNNTGVTKTVAILAAFFNTLKVVSAADGSPAAISETNAAAITAAGFPCDYVLDDGTIATDLIASSANSKMSIRAFKEYIKQGGRMLVDMSVRANNAAAFEKTMEVVKCSPLKGSAPQYLPLTDFKSVDQSADDKIVVRDLNLEMSYDTLMLLPIEDGHEVTISFGFAV